MNVIGAWIMIELSVWGYIKGWRVGKQIIWVESDNYYYVLSLDSWLYGLLCKAQN